MTAVLVPITQIAESVTFAPPLGAGAATQRATAEPAASRWYARVVAIGGPGAESWRPPTVASERAERSAVALRADGVRYDLEFEVSAEHLALATRAAMAKWARLYELCELPDWDLVSVTVEREGLAPVRSAAARRGRPRRSPSSPGSRRVASTDPDIVTSGRRYSYRSDLSAENSSTGPSRVPELSPS
jgi:hypothetical protein